MLLSFVLAMFIDSITVILFLAAVTVELSQLLKFNPVPMILAEIFCANLGGSATMCGDPPNIIIGTSLGFSFADFVTNTGLIALIALVLVVIYFYFVFRKELTENAGKIDPSTLPDPSEAITDKKGFIISWIIFLCAVVLLVSHSQTGLTVSCIGVFIAAVTLITSGKDALELLKKVDYKTLLFFVGLFVVVGGLEQTGILTILAGFIGKVSGGNLKVMIAIIIWVSAVASAFIDNIPFAATMIPVIDSLAASQGIDISILAWGSCNGYGYRWKCNPNRSFCKRSRNRYSSQERTYDQMGQILQGYGTGYYHCNPCIHVHDLCKIFIKEGYYENAETGHHFHWTRVWKCRT